MKLDIVVPHYKEPWEVCKYLFDSIAMQRCVLFENIRVIVVNDGDDVVFDPDRIPDYPYKIVCHVKAHEGVSAARNYGLDQSDADYVMFCDIDDGFLNNYALHTIFCAMEEGFDLLIPNFVEETFTGEGNMTIVKHEHDLTFMHGKVYRRQFLVDNDLRFDPAMTLHEDGYFNMLVYTVAQHGGKIQNVNTPLYIWRWNDNSVVRLHRKDFVLKTYEDVILVRRGICNELKHRGFEDDFQTAVCMTVLNSYYDFQKPAYLDVKNQKYVKKAEKAFKSFWDEFGDTFLQLTNQKVAEVARIARENAYKNGMLFEQVALKTWLKHIINDVKI